MYLEDVTSQKHCNVTLKGPITFTYEIVGGPAIRL